MNQKEQTIDLLNEIHQGSQMGVEAIDTLLNKVKSGDFKTKLMEMQNEYKNIAAATNVELQKYGGIPHEIPVSQRVSAWSMSNMQTLVNNSTEHMADMMLKGTNMGLRDINKAINNNIYADEKAKNLARQFITVQQKHAEEMSRYLH